VVYGSEKPATKRSRALIAVLGWVLFGLPIVAALWFLIGWWVLLLVIPLLWATRDFIQRGGGDVTKILP
jgi:hypothetical protein